MQSIAYIRGSAGAANASVATVQNVRAALATTIIVNTVSGIPAKFYGSMGTPHTFTDPVTGETITVISEASAVDFAGSVSGGNLNIDAIAPGYTDAGSKVGDIVVIRPVTEWANNLANILGASHNDDGTIKNSSITADAQFATAVSPVKRASQITFDFVVPGGAVLAGLGYGSTLTASLSAGECYINGNYQIIAAVATRTYTASKDTYVDALYDASGTAVIVYTEVANNAASPLLAANSIRLGIVVSGANIAAVTSINQGQENKLLPIVSSIPYAVTDSLGNLICPRDPNRKILGVRQRLVDFTSTATAATDITGLNLNVNIPTGRKVKVTFDNTYTNSSQSAGQSYQILLVDVTAGVNIKQKLITTTLSSNAEATGATIVVTPPAAGVRNYKVQFLQSSAGTFTCAAESDGPAQLIVELV